MKRTSRTKKPRTISANRFDSLFERGADARPYLDFRKATVVRRVNVDFPAWMVERLDREAKKLNISRQAVIKMWVHDRLESPVPGPGRGERTSSPYARLRHLIGVARGGPADLSVRTGEKPKALLARRAQSGGSR